MRFDVTTWGNGMGPWRGFQVDPSTLVVGAAACRDLRGSMGTGLADVEAGSTTAQAGLAGWRTRRALEELLWWWRDDLDRLGRRLDATADALEACARGYRNADEVGQDSFDAALRPM